MDDRSLILLAESELFCAHFFIMYGFGIVRGGGFEI